MTRTLILLALLGALSACGKQSAPSAASAAEPQSGAAANAIIYGLNIIGESMNEH